MLYKTPLLHYKNVNVFSHFTRRERNIFFQIVVDQVLMPFKITAYTYPRATSSLRASMWPSKAAHNVGVIPLSSLVLQSFLVASFKISRIFSLAALKVKIYSIK